MQPAQLITLIIVIGACTALIGWQVSAIDMNCECEGMTLEEYKENKEISDLKFTEEAFQRFAENRNYTEDYNCVNYSLDFKETMKSFGIKADYTGGHNNETGHMWNTIQLHIEPQTGELNLFRQYNQTYHEGYFNKYDKK